jgi:hypothetical protein
MGIVCQPVPPVKVKKPLTTQQQPSKVKKHIDAHQKKLKGKKKQTPGYKILVPAFTPSTN